MQPAENLWGKSREELTGLLGERYNCPGYIGGQVFQWLYQKLEFDPQNWTNISKDLRAQIRSDFRVELPRVTHRQESSDGTVKYILENSAGQEFETVWLPFPDRVSLCVSSQAGCTLDCVFCATGKLPLKGNLGVGDILGQLVVVSRDMGRRPNNLVFMGMGEPFYNYNRVMTATDILLDDRAFHYGARRVTISTAGVLPRIHQFIDEKRRVALALSINHSNEAGRGRVMPINDKYSMADLKKAALRFNRELDRAITIEYVMMAGENISPADADRLSEFLKGIKFHLNLIPLNTDFAGFRRPDPEEIASFQSRLRQTGGPVINRRSPARDIDGACGMLALKTGK